MRRPSPGARGGSTDVKRGGKTDAEASGKSRGGRPAESRVERGQKSLFEPERPAGHDAEVGRPTGLHAEVRALQARLTELREEVGRNDALLRKTQDRELELLRAASLRQLLERMIEGLKSS